MIIDTPRPKRRLLGRFLWPIVITAAAVIAVVVSSAGDDTRAELGYLGVMSDQVADISKGGDTLRVVISRLSRIERSELVTATDGIRASLESGLELVQEGPPTEGLVAVNALYRQALEAWTVGLSGFTSGILAAADDPDSTVVVDNIANSLVELRAGDRLYNDLVEELQREDVPHPVGPMPEVRLVPAEGEMLSLSQAYVEAARAVNSGIALRPGLAVSQIVSDPLWNVNPDDQAVVPATETVTFSVVVTNSGNVESVPEPLVLTLAGDGDPVEMSEQVPILAPGAQTAVMFEDISVQGGGIYEVTADLQVRNPDIDFDDNLMSVIFTVSNESS